MLFRSNSMKNSYPGFFALFIAGIALYSCGNVSSKEKVSDSIVQAIVDTPEIIENTLPVYQLSVPRWIQHYTTRKYNTC